jgi:class 3 adenylate cyclase
MPLINPEGFSLGSLCVLDFQPREISFEQGEAVKRLARQVVILLELRRSLLQLDRTRHELQDEREKSERLLRNMLPVGVALELKSGNRVTARFYDAATILFADFEGFTKLAETMEPKELIGQLDDYFSAFDEIAERHRLEMLKTIGDAYMCVGGVPEGAQKATSALLGSTRGPAHRPGHCRCSGSQKIHLRRVGGRCERGGPHGIRGCSQQDQCFGGDLSSHEGPVRVRVAG